MENLCDDPCYRHNHVRLSFVTNEDIAIEFDQDTPETTECINSIPFLTFNENLYKWTCHNQYYASLVTKVQQLKSCNPPIRINPIPPFVFKAFRTQENPIVDIPLEEHIEPSLANALKDYQKAGVCFGISKSGRLLIADEMGLGKTHQGIALADYYKDDWPLLVVTTATMRQTWVSKFEELLPAVDPANIFCITSSDQEINNSARIVVTSYALMSANVDTLVKHRFGAIILDESHYVKNYQANKTEAAQILCESAKRVILLSGTPALSRPKELYQQLLLIDPHFTSFINFAKRYCEAYQMEHGWYSNGASYLEELRLLLNKRFMIRRTKEEHVEGLTDKLRERIFIRIAREDRLQLARYAAGFTDGDIFFSYYTATAEAKVASVCDYVENFVQNTNDKFIIFAHHTVMMNGIEEILNEQEVEHIRIDGKTRPDDRDDLINRFQTDDDCRVALMSIVTSGTGLNLTAAKQVIFAELTYTPGVKSHFAIF